MTFAKTVKNELRATFGPKWVASGLGWVMVVVGLITVVSVGLDLVAEAEMIGATLTEMSQ